MADDRYLVREALVHLLGDTPELDLVATCEDGDALLAAVDAELPDAVLTDIRMPPSREDEGIAIANRLRTTHPSMGVVVVSQYATPSTPWRCSSTGRTAAPTCSRSGSPIAPS